MALVLSTYSPAQAQAAPFAAQVAELRNARSSEPMTSSTGGDPAAQVATPSSASTAATSTATSAATREPEPQISERARARLAAEARQEQQRVQAEIQTLAARDREVRAHEQAHVAAGGQYAGAPVYQYERGPNGVQYAVGGEVPISTSEEATAEATLRKAQIVRRAALAPLNPSPQDRRVAAMASQMETRARLAIAEQARAESDPREARMGGGDEQEVATNPSNSEPDTAKAAERDDLFRAEPNRQVKNALTMHNTIFSEKPGSLIHQIA